MQGDKNVIAILNEQLTAELTAINQYWLHYKLQENNGWVKLAKHTRHESIEEMQHADKLAERIIFLDGLPNFQKLSPLRIGQTVTEMFECDMKVELEAVERLRRGIKLMRDKDDVTSANLFEEILEDEEEHIDYLETQLDLVKKLGEPLYLAQLVQQPEHELTGDGPQSETRSHSQSRGLAGRKLASPRTRMSRPSSKRSNSGDSGLAHVLADHDPSERRQVRELLLGQRLEVVADLAHRLGHLLAAWSRDTAAATCSPRSPYPPCTGRSGRPRTPRRSPASRARATA